MDFYQIAEKSPRKGCIDIFPDFKVGKSNDLMVRGRSFYAIWDNEIKIWSTNEYDVQRLVDQDLSEYLKKRSDDGNNVSVKWMSSFSSKSWINFKKYCKEVADNYKQLDETLTFSNTQTRKNNYVSKRLSYPLEPGTIDAYEELISTLYSPDERHKLEWAIGSIVAGDSKQIQKFVVLYGPPGSGKSTALNIIQWLFEGYYTMFEARALASSSNAFATEMFKDNPLVAIQHDGDLSRIEDNTKLNSIISHEEMVINEKFKSSYVMRLGCFLFMGSNKAVKITDAYAGILRRLLDIHPTGSQVPAARYHTLLSQISFELGAIANHCLNVYREAGKNFYQAYRPTDMMYKTDMFFNFVEENYMVFKEQDGCTLSQAFTMYKTYCDESGSDFRLKKYQFREELKAYFKEFSEMVRVDGKPTRNYYSGFLSTKFVRQQELEKSVPCSLVLDSNESLLDSILAGCPAQLSVGGVPRYKWENVRTTLAEIDTSNEHFVRPTYSQNHIVVDFDLRGEDGEKSLERNLEAASNLPPTYSELSKSGKGVHLHYLWDGDVTKLSRVFDDGIEIKVFTGGSSLRRKLTKCNNTPVATINSGLPLKEEKPVLNKKTIQNEGRLRALIQRNLFKEIHPSTKSSMDFIKHILDEAYKQGLHYDVSDMRPHILSFAANSTNQAEKCMEIVNTLKLKSEELPVNNDGYVSDELVFFDVEVFPNLCVVVWKPQGKKPVRLINPTPREIEKITNFKLVGYNCRRYDNHILYAIYNGFDNEQVYDLSQRIIGNSKTAFFGEAYNLSYTDVYCFLNAGNKKSLKKWQIELGIYHLELGLPWDKPVPKELWDKVAEYCENDVKSLEVVWDHPDVQGDWAARQILAALSGLLLNDTTNAHTTRYVFGKDRNPQSEFNYPDLSKRFKGYTFERGVSMYRGIKVGEGGYVYAEPGMYFDVAVLDVASQHPTSIVVEELFGPRYTPRYAALKDGRVAIKHGDIDIFSKMFDGKLVPFIEETQKPNPKFTLKQVSTGLKTGLNSAYGLTFARFTNAFKDPRNIDNCVAKRGALFMVELQHAVQEKGFIVAHIKTDSIKIPNATQEIIDFVIEFAKGYGYDMEHETTYSKFCLVNDSVYIAQDSETGKWEATGAQFAHPYVFKILFSKEPIDFEDLCEAKAVTGTSALYLMEDADEPIYHFVGKVGLFTPVNNGLQLMRENDGKYYAVTGTKGFLWMESDSVKDACREDDIDYRYFSKLVDAAVDNISKYGDFDAFVSDNKTTDIFSEDYPPWKTPCGKDEPCKGCKKNGCDPMCLNKNNKEEECITPF